MRHFHACARNARPPGKLNSLRLSASTANVSDAVKGSGVSRATAYRYRDQDRGFRDAWDDALEEAVDALSTRGPPSRGRGGREDRLSQGGRVWPHSRVQRHSANVPVRAHRPEKYRDNAKVQTEANVKAYAITNSPDDL